MYPDMSSEESWPGSTYSCRQKKAPQKSVISSPITGRRVIQYDINVLIIPVLLRGTPHRNHSLPWRALRYWQQAAPWAPQNITLNSWGPPSAPALRWYPQMSCRVSSQQRWSGLGLGCGVAERKGKKRRNPVKFWVRALSWEPALHPSIFSPRWCNDRFPVGGWPSCPPLSHSSSVVQS